MARSLKPEEDTSLRASLDWGAYSCQSRPACAEDSAHGVAGCNSTWSATPIATTSPSENVSWMMLRGMRKWFPRSKHEGAALSRRTILSISRLRDPRLSFPNLQSRATSTRSRRLMISGTSHMLSPVNAGNAMGLLPRKRVRRSGRNNPPFPSSKVQLLP